MNPADKVQQYKNNCLKVPYFKTYTSMCTVYVNVTISCCVNEKKRCWFDFPFEFVFLSMPCCMYLAAKWEVTAYFSRIDVLIG